MWPILGEPAVTIKGRQEKAPQMKEKQDPFPALEINRESECLNQNNKRENPSNRIAGDERPSREYQDKGEQIESQGDNPQKRDRGYIGG
jgi:hypothetical protein